MNKLIEKFKAIENTKPIISLKDYNKHRFILSLIVIVFFCINYFHNSWILFPLILDMVIIRDINLFFKYQKEKSDELVQYNESLSNRIIILLLSGFILIMSIISKISNFSI